MKKNLLVIVLFIPVLLFSQGRICPCKWQTIFSTGIIAGQSTAKPSYHLSSGVSNKQLFAGIGAGLDIYRFRSLPVYADLRSYFGKSKLAFFYTNTGYNIPYGKQNGLNNYMESRYYGGFYLDAGIGYRIPVNKRNGILFSAGYSHKRINAVSHYVFECWLPPCTENYYRYQYDLGRVVAKLSWAMGKTK